MSDALDRYQAERKRTSRKADLINRRANEIMGNEGAVERAENNEDDK